MQRPRLSRPLTRGSAPGRIGAAIVLAILLLAIAAAWLLAPLGEWLAGFDDWLLKRGIWGILLFALVYILATISLAPEWPLTIAAGMLYGIWGFPITVVTATIAASLAFLIARHVARRQVRALVERRPTLCAIDEAVAETGWKIVALSRLSPAVPFNVQNYLFGVTAIGFSEFVAATFAGIMPGAALYIYIGMLGKTAASGSSRGPLTWALFALGLAATVAAIVLVSRTAHARLRRAGIDTESP